MSAPVGPLVASSPSAAAAPAPQLMGILNITPDSFSDGGLLVRPEQVVALARSHVAGGATWLDVGAESTRPGAEPVPVAVELERLRPALAALAEAQVGARISVDTRRAEVAQAALAWGAHAINDVSALADPAMAPLLARHRLPVILMHWAGPAPVGGHHNVHYDDVVQEVAEALMRSRERALAAGILPSNIWLDPGLGFGKTTEHALALTQGMPTLAALGHPIVYGASRKRFLQHIVGRSSQDCDAATAAACCAAVLGGAQVLRVHQPAAVRDAMLVATALRAH